MGASGGTGGAPRRSSARSAGSRRGALSPAHSQMSLRLTGPAASRGGIVLLCARWEWEEAPISRRCLDVQDAGTCERRYPAAAAAQAPAVHSLRPQPRAAAIGRPRRCSAHN